jgi:hypothetical protein
MQAITVFSSPPMQRAPAPMMRPARLAEQTYTQADVARLLRIQSKRVAALLAEGKIPAPAVLVPGGGHKGRRWLASQLAEIMARWAA